MESAALGPGGASIKRLGVMTKFVGLRAKTYAAARLLTPWPPPQEVSAGAVQQDEVKKAKGVPKAVIKRSLHLDDYRALVQVPLSQLQPRREGERPAPPTLATVEHHFLRSERHAITLRRGFKRALSAADDKRHVLPCGLHTLAHSPQLRQQVQEGQVPQCPFCGGLERRAGRGRRSF